MWSKRMLWTVDISEDSDSWQWQQRSGNPKEEKAEEEISGKAEVDGENAEHCAHLGPLEETWVLNGTFVDLGPL